MHHIGTTCKHQRLRLHLYSESDQICLISNGLRVSTGHLTSLLLSTVSLSTPECQSTKFASLRTTTGDRTANMIVTIAATYLGTSLENSQTMEQI